MCSRSASAARWSDFGSSSTGCVRAKQHFLNLRPLPHGHGSFRPGFPRSMVSGFTPVAERDCTRCSSPCGFNRHPYTRVGRFTHGRYAACQPSGMPASARVKHNALSPARTARVQCHSERQGGWPDGGFRSRDALRVAAGRTRRGPPDVTPRQPGADSRSRRARAASRMVPEIPTRARRSWAPVRLHARDGSTWRVARPMRLYGR